MDMAKETEVKIEMDKEVGIEKKTGLTEETEGDGDVEMVE